MRHQLLHKQKMRRRLRQSLAPRCGGSGNSAPLVGKYQLTEAGKVYVQLSDGKKYTTTIAPQTRTASILLIHTPTGDNYERVP